MVILSSLKISIPIRPCPFTTYLSTLSGKPALPKIIGFVRLILKLLKLYANYKKYK